jgi:hypothetical protein
MQRKSVLFFLCGFIIAAGIQPGNAEVVGMTLVSGYPLVANVFVDGHGPFRFLVDTGAQTNQMDSALAERLGLRCTFRTVLATAAGEAVVAGGRVGEVRIGSAAASDQEFLYSSLEGVRRVSGDIQGVLGQEFLRRFDYLLDFRGRQIVFGGNQPPGANRVPLDRIDGRPAIETDRGRLVIDSGARAAILYSAGGEAGGMMLVTAAGRAAGAEERSIRIHAGGHVYWTKAVLAQRGSLREDGLLPATLFRSIYVSNSEEFVVLDPPRLH